MHYSVAITKSPYGDGMSVMGMHLAASADARLLWALGGYGREKGNFLAIGIKDVESALADGANPDAVDSLRNRRALHFAVEKGAPTAVALLLHRKAVVNRKDIDGRTALHTAARLENPAKTKNSRSNGKNAHHFGADVNAGQRHHDTAPQRSVAERQSSSVSSCPGRTFTQSEEETSHSVALCASSGKSRCLADMPYISKRFQRLGVDAGPRRRLTSPSIVMLPLSWTFC